MPVTSTAQGCQVNRTERGVGLTFLHRGWEREGGLLIQEDKAKADGGVCQLVKSGTHWANSRPTTHLIEYIVNYYMPGYTGIAVYIDIQRVTGAAFQYNTVIIAF